MTINLTFDHGSISVRDLDEAIVFYEDALGLERLDRPDFGFPGAWFKAGAVPIHLTTGGSVDRIAVPRPPEPHLALAVAKESELDELVSALRDRGQRQKHPSRDSR